MNLPIEVRFERIRKRTRTNEPGKVHLTVNGREVGWSGSEWTRENFRNHRGGGVEQVSVEEFLRDPCPHCLRAVNPKVA
jgi:hypothetical protein